MTRPETIRAEALRLVREHGCCRVAELRRLASGSSINSQQSYVAKVLRELVETGVLAVRRERDDVAAGRDVYAGRRRINVYRPGPAWSGES